MKRYQTHLFALVLTITLLGCISGASAQPVEYHLHHLGLSTQNQQSIYLYGMNDQGIVYGRWTESDGSDRGFFYELIEDSAATGGYTGQYSDLAAVLGEPTGWSSNRCHQINQNGLGIGVVILTNGERKGIWFDLNASPPSWDFLPEPDVAGGSPNFSPTFVNDTGDVVVSFVNEIGSRESYIYNPILADPPVYLTDDTGTPLEIQGWAKVTNDGSVIGTAKSSSGDYIFAWNQLLGLAQLTPPGEASLASANAWGDFSGSYYTSSSGGPENGLIYRANTQSFEFLSEFTERATAINNAGDAIVLSDQYADAYLLHSGTLINLRDTVVGENASFFQSADSISDNWNGTGSLTNRDSTGFGKYCCRAEKVTTTGKGRNKTTFVDQRWFILIPQPQSPGISLSPNSGLTTTEGGGIAEFSVVLDAEPAADVTIGINSSNTNEGAVAQASLTFTPADWDTPQTVTITGVDDEIEDGDVVYSIDLDPAASIDPIYANLDPTVVSVTNVDNESSGGGGNGNGNGKGKNK